MSLASCETETEYFEFRWQYLSITIERAEVRKKERKNWKVGVKTCVIKAEYDSLLAVAAAAASSADGIDRGSGFRRHTEPSTIVLFASI